MMVILLGGSPTPFFAQPDSATAKQPNRISPRQVRNTASLLD